MPELATRKIFSNRLWVCSWSNNSLWKCCFYTVWAEIYRFQIQKGRTLLGLNSCFHNVHFSLHALLFKGVVLSCRDISTQEADETMGTVRIHKVASKALLQPKTQIRQPAAFQRSTISNILRPRERVLLQRRDTEEHSDRKRCWKAGGIVIQPGGKARLSGGLKHGNMDRVSNIAACQFKGTKPSNVRFAPSAYFSPASVTVGSNTTCKSVKLDKPKIKSLRSKAYVYVNGSLVRKFNICGLPMV